MAKNNVQKRINEEKEKLLSEFEQSTNVSLICKKTGISRATYYRWLEEDAKFKGRVKKTQEKGSAYISDIMESRLISLAQEGSLPAVIFWLKHHKHEYMEPERLTKEEILRDIRRVVKESEEFIFLKEDQEENKRERERKQRDDEMHAALKKVYAKRRKEAADAPIRLPTEEVRVENERTVRLVYGDKEDVKEQSTNEKIEEISNKLKSSLKAK